MNYMNSPDHIANLGADGVANQDFHPNFHPAMTPLDEQAVNGTSSVGFDAGLVNENFATPGRRSLQTLHTSELLHDAIFGCSAVPNHPVPLAVPLHSVPDGPHGAFSTLAAASATVHQIIEHLLPNTCDQCLTTFRNRTELHKHAKDLKHLAFRCSCGKATGRHDVLRRHLDCDAAQPQGQASRKLKRECPYCDEHNGDKGFTRQDHLIQHLKGRHNFSDKGVALHRTRNSRKTPRVATPAATGGGAPDVVPAPALVPNLAVYQSSAAQATGYLYRSGDFSFENSLGYNNFGGFDFNTSYF